MTGRSGIAGALLALVSVLAACNDDEPEAGEQTTTTEATDDPAGSESLDGALIEASDLPGTFVAVPEGEDPTVTTFCAGQDATAGLSAEARAIALFRREPAGAAVLQVAVRFTDDGSVRFVEQARSLLAGCEEIPDASGLAFTYEPPPAGLDELLAGRADDHVSQRQVSVGSGNIVTDLAIFRSGDVGELVAVTGADGPPPDGLALAVTTAALDRLEEG